MSQTSQEAPSISSRTDRPSILRAQAIKKSYATGREVLHILRHVDLSLGEGEFVAIEGKSGSGKSTLMHIMGGLDRADSGSLVFEGRGYAANPPGWLQPTPFRVLLGVPLRLRMGVAAAIWLLATALVYRVHYLLPIFPLFWLVLWIATPLLIPLFLWLRAERTILGVAIAWLLVVLSWCTYVSVASWLPGLLAGIGMIIVLGVYLAVCGYMAERPLCKLRMSSFGFVFQFYHLLPELNVLENAMMPTLVERSWLGYFREKRRLRARASKILTEVGLGDRLRHKPNQLSGGERQRVAIARALMNEPKILFADEPTGNLDVETGKQIMAVLERLHRERKQTIVMVTHDRSVASMADRILVLRNGRLERPSELPVSENSAATISQRA